MDKGYWIRLILALTVKDMGVAIIMGHIIEEKEILEEDNESLEVIGEGPTGEEAIIIREIPIPMVPAEKEAEVEEENEMNVQENQQILWGVFVWVRNFGSTFRVFKSPESSFTGAVIEEENL